MNVEQAQEIKRREAELAEADEVLARQRRREDRERSAKAAEEANLRKVARARELLTALTQARELLTPHENRSGDVGLVLYKLGELEGRERRNLRRAEERAGIATPSDDDPAEVQV